MSTKTRTLGAMVTNLRHERVSQFFPFAFSMIQLIEGLTYVPFLVCLETVNFLYVLTTVKERFELCETRNCYIWHSRSFVAARNIIPLPLQQSIDLGVQDRE